jgi:hypothetical protein
MRDDKVTVAPRLTLRRRRQGLFIRFIAVEVDAGSARALRVIRR